MQLLSERIKVTGVWLISEIERLEKQLAEKDEEIKTLKLQIALQGTNIPRIKTITFTGVKE
jgi:hypothetical protein